MSEKRSGSGCLWVALASVLLACIVCCCGGGLAVWMGPGAFVKWMIQPEPLTVQTVPQNPEAAANLAQRFSAGGEVSIEPRELVQLLTDEPDEDLAALWIDAQGDTAALDLSILMKDATPAGYLNLHMKTRFSMRRGWFDNLEFDELTVGPMDLGGFIKGQDLAQNVNQNLAQQRAQDPEMGEKLDRFELLTVRDGKFVVELAPGAWEEFTADP